MRKILILLLVFLPIVMATSQSGSVDLSLGVDTTFYSWSVPMSGIWNVTLSANLTASTTTNLSFNISEEGSLYSEDSCTSCTSLSLSNFSNTSYTSGDVIDFSANWFAPTLGIDWSDVFNNWVRFSHQNGVMNASLSEMNSWSYDSENDRILSTVNSVTYVGFVSNENYTNYGLEATLKSSNSDDDSISLVLAYVEQDGYQHTLSAVRADDGIGGGSYHWWVEYDLDAFSPDASKVIYDGSSNLDVYSRGWSTYTEGTKVSAVRTDNLIRIKTTELNSTTYKPETEYVINLSADSRLHKFLNGSAIGFGAFSQADSTFESVTISTSTSEFSYFLDFSCSGIGCLCESDSDCDSSTCKSSVDSNLSYCSQPADSCSQSYNESLAINETSSSFLCSGEEESVECSVSNPCQIENGFYCTEDLNWSNSGVEEYGCYDDDSDGTPDRYDTLDGSSTNVSFSGSGSVTLNISGSNSSSPSDVQNVSIYSSSIPLIQFTHNFTNSSLNVSNISITSSTSGMIVSVPLQAGRNKTIGISDPGFISLCVRDAPTTSLSQISSTCTEGNETDFDTCLSNSTGVTIGNLTCIDHGNYITVSGLTHSAITGELPESTQVEESAEETTRSSDDSYRPKHYIVGDAEDGVTQSNLWRTDKFSFNYSGERYTILVDDFGNLVDGGWSEITILSTSQDIILQIGESRDVDLNGDGVVDVKTTLLDITRNRMTFYVKSLDEIKEVPSVEQTQQIIQEETDSQPINETEERQSPAYFMGFLTSFIIALAISLIYRFRKPIWKFLV